MDDRAYDALLELCDEYKADLWNAKDRIKKLKQALANMVEGQYPTIPRTATELTEIRQKALANAQKLLEGPL